MIGVLKALVCQAIGEQMRTEEVTAVPKADSSAVLLTQALHTEDSDLLEVRGPTSDA